MTIRSKAVVSIFLVCNFGLALSGLKWDVNQLPSGEFARSIFVPINYYFECCLKLCSFIIPWYNVCFLNILTIISKSFFVLFFLSVTGSRRNIYFALQNIMVAAIERVFIPKAVGQNPLSI